MNPAAIPGSGAERRLELLAPPETAPVSETGGLSKWKTTTLLFGVWTLIGLFRAIERYTLDPTMQDRLEFGFREALAQNLLAAYLWAAFTPPVVRIARRRTISRAGRFRAILAHFAASILFPVAHSALFFAIYPAVMGIPSHFASRIEAMPSVLQVFFLTNFLTYWGVAGVTWTVDSYRMSRERELRASELERQLAGARLEALKMQLHPHFLFNALNSILPLVFRDRDAAARTVVQLGDLLRLSLRTKSTHLIPLAEEVKVLRLYLEIQKTRFQDRLSVSLRIEPDMLGALVPNLILQPLVENAIKHGVAAHTGSGRVEVHGFRDKDFLVLRVRDNGPGLEEGAHPESGGGVGLRNTRGRLQYLYEGRHRFEYANRPEGGLVITLAIPLEDGERQ